MSEGARRHRTPPPRYFAGRAPLEIAGRVAIVVDDGIATGATIRAAVAGLKARMPAKIVVAVSVAPPSAIAELEKEADEVVCPIQPRMLGAIGYFYRDFEQLTDEEVIGLLATHRA
ncbi:phosphoribosyltransferase family protein [Sinorhizobium fredii]|uniref:phosphoribosyltransferase family protein n=1 Tax=Rhizobium fredii TaxID=380 RepID=UPI002FCDF9EC